MQFEIWDLGVLFFFLLFTSLRLLYDTLRLTTPFYYCLRHPQTQTIIFIKCSLNVILIILYIYYITLTVNSLVKLEKLYTTVLTSLGIDFFCDFV